jgi:hypothetical protein
LGAGLRRSIPAFKAGVSTGREYVDSYEYDTTYDWMAGGEINEAGGYSKPPLASAMAPCVHAAVAWLCFRWPPHHRPPRNALSSYRRRQQPAPPPTDRRRRRRRRCDRRYNYSNLVVIYPSVFVHPGQLDHFLAYARGAHQVFAPSDRAPAPAPRRWTLGGG